jgi:DNA-binding IclR family transcriptional regulator
MNGGVDMSSVTKTLELLAHFSAKRPEIGLSQLSKLVKRDKATTYRHLQALEDAGFVEKNGITKQYRLGPAVLQLAQTREITVPRKAGASAALLELANATGETAHISVLSGTTLYSLDARESLQHGTRAIIDLQTFPLHATASGICAVAFGPPELAEVAGSKMTSFTSQTVSTTKGLEEKVQLTRAYGIAHSDRGFEDEVYGMAAPVFDHTGAFAGSIAVATVATRFTADLERLILKNLVKASRAVTRNWGGESPQNIENAWASCLINSPELEPTP